MTDDEEAKRMAEGQLVEKVALAMRDAYIKAHDDPPYNNPAHYPLTMFTDEARAAIAVVLEEAAKVADQVNTRDECVALAIRALKGTE